jgi:hypothetical protein
MDDYIDRRQAVIDRMNTGRAASGKPVLTPRQEHLVREFTDDDGNVLEQELLLSLLQSNSA